jgi:ketosteroid isomerase-like protein
MPAKAPQAGISVPVVVKLATKDGKPVTSAELELAHTKLVHLLIVDASLTNYLHEHPVETAPGEWSFAFNPKTGGTYTVFADLLPKATGAQEYAKTTVTVAGAARPLDTSLNLSATVDGYRFDLKIPADEPLTAGAASLVSVHVTKPDGSAATNLEPIMAAFAHGVGFTADLSSVLHVHPMGKEPEADTERGGPDLSFHLQPAMPGFFKFYVQVQIDGQSRFAGFGLNAAPARPEVAGHHHDGMTYSCPMHPAVTSGKSGDRCPKCGMALVPTADASPAADSSDHDAIKAVLGAYNRALTSLDAAKAQDLFTADSAVFESGGVEGTFAHYLEHHIGPELAEFKEFSFRDYKVEVRLEPPVALATETYIYKIVLKEGDRVIEKRGVATSVLKKVAGEWKIIQTHTSSRNVPKKN